MRIITVGRIAGLNRLKEAVMKEVKRDPEFIIILNEAQAAPMVAEGILQQIAEGQYSPIPKEGIQAKTRKRKTSEADN